MENITTTHFAEDLTFSWYDYALFSLMLLLSALIGVYFGFIKKQNTAKDYLLGGKEMSVFPISMSLIASSISGMTILAVPADIYRYGITYWLCMPTMAVVILLAYYIFVPVFYELQITSAYEYLSMRFDNRVRSFTSLVFIFSMFTYLPIIIYVPALALSQGTGIGIHMITPIICGICIFYTTVGGLKAVVWTDALQFVIMIGAIVAVFILGIIDVGGFEVVWKRSLDMGRLDVNFDMDITKRDSFWTGTIGAGFMWMCYIGTNQGFVQKCVALPTYPDVKKALIIFGIGMLILISMICFTGLIMFATYHKCDPLTTGKVAQPDQLIPYYIMDVARNIPGLPGIFIAGVFSAALSTLSAVMNCLAAIIFEDFISSRISKDVSQERISTILKWLAVIIGVVSTALVFVVEHLGSMLPLAFSIAGMTGGPILGEFIIGMLFPNVNAQGAFWGGVVSLVIMVWIIAGSQWYKNHNIITYPPLVHSVEECPLKITTNSTIQAFSNSTIAASTEHVEPFYLYKLSFYYYVLLGLLIVIVVSCIVSYFTKRKDDKPVSKSLLTPCVRRFVSNNDIGSPPVYYSIENAATIVKHNVEIDK